MKRKKRKTNVQSSRPKPQKDELWSHFKGNRYTIVAVTPDEASGKAMVVYKAPHTGEVKVREYENFMESVYRPEHIGYRFTKVQ